MYYGPLDQQLTSIRLTVSFDLNNQPASSTQPNPVEATRHDSLPPSSPPSEHPSDAMEYLMAETFELFEKIKDWKYWWVKDGLPDYIWQEWCRYKRQDEVKEWVRKMEKAIRQADYWVEKVVKVPVRDPGYDSLTKDETRDMLFWVGYYVAELSKIRYRISERVELVVLGKAEKYESILNGREVSEKGRTPNRVYPIPK